MLVVLLDVSVLVPVVADRVDEAVLESEVPGGGPGGGPSGGGPPGPCPLVLDPLCVDVEELVRLESWDRKDAVAADWAEPLASMVEPLPADDAEDVLVVVVPAVPVVLVASPVFDAWSCLTICANRLLLELLTDSDIWLGLHDADVGNLPAHSLKEC